MSHCVPSWDFEDPPSYPANFATGLEHHSTIVPPSPLNDNYEVAELAWENGQLALHGYGAKPAVQPSGWNKHRNHTGTLESVVHQATGAELFQGAAHDFVEWLGDHNIAKHCNVNAFEPCRDAEVPAASVSARVAGVCSSQGSMAAPPSMLRDERISESVDTRGVTDEVEFTNTTVTATETATDSDLLADGSGASLPETVGICFRAKRINERRLLPTKRDEMWEQDKGKGLKREAQRPSSYNKKGRAAIIHNQSERKRRDRINQKMETLQKLVPNSSKTDKASILDEVIEYLKQLQAQVQAMNRMSSMMLPMPMPQMQMAMMANMAQMAQMAQMRLGIVDMASVNRPAQTAIPPFLHPSTFLPLNSPTWNNFSDRIQRDNCTARPDPFSAFLAYQNAQHPMNLDGYNRMATLFQQLYPQTPPANPLK